MVQHVLPEGVLHDFVLGEDGVRDADRYFRYVGHAVPDLAADSVEGLEVLLILRDVD